MHFRQLFIAAVLLACAFVAPTRADAQAYIVHEIASQPGNDGYTWARTVNDAGVVFGLRELPTRDGTDSVLYQDMKEFAVLEPHPVNRRFVWPGAVSNGGIVVHTRVVPVFFEGIRAYVSSLETGQQQFVLFEQNTSTHVNDISNGTPAVSVGERETPGTFEWRAYRVVTDGQNNPPLNLGTLGGPLSTAEAINAAGQIVGASLTTEGPLRAFRWSNGSMTDLGTLGGSVSWGKDVNDSGIIVGWARLADGAAQAFRWQNGAMTGLGTLGGDYSEANGINNLGEIVGMSLDEQGRPRAFLHDGDEMINLNTRIPANSGWTLQYAQDINVSGVIVGWGRYNGKTRGFILEPTTIPNVPGDLNGDGVVDVTDLLILIANWGRCAECDACPADLDGHCAVDVSDLLILLANWG